MIVAVQLDQGVQPVGFLENVEVLALEVLDQGDLHGLVFGDIELDAGQLLQADVLRGDEPALPGDDLEPVAHGPDKDGLENALGADRIHELLDVPELAPRLMGIRVDLLDGDHPDPRTRACARR